MQQRLQRLWGSARTADVDPTLRGGQWQPDHDGEEGLPTPAPNSPTAQLGIPAAHLPSGEAAPLRVAWLSLDPMRGSLSVYARDVAMRIESAFQRGEDSVALGCFGASVYFDAEGPECHLQRTAGGRRDVCRWELDSGDGVAAMRVHRPGRAWRMLRDATADPPWGTEVCEVLLGEDVLDPDADAGQELDPAGADAAEAALPVASARGGAQLDLDTKNPDIVPERWGTVSDGDSCRSSVLWEWCRKDGQHTTAAGTLPTSAWGVYSREQNEEIEAAFQAGQPDVEVSVGIRTYRLIFGPEADFARQVDDVLHKRRLVRRRLATVEECTRALEPAAPEVPRGQESCPICWVDFAESANIPVLELPGCQHVFHAACAQQLADSGSTCPCCRAEVNWLEVGLVPQPRR